MTKYAKMIKDLRAKNFKETRIKELVLEKAKTELQNFNFAFKGFKVKEDAGAEAGKTIEIEGYASTKDEDRYGDIVNPEAFEETAKQFMTNPVMLLQHDHNKRIGDFTDLTIDENGLYVKGDVKYTAGDSELFEKIENKSLRGFSIGFRVLEAEFQDKTDEKGNVVDWLFVIKKLDLIEISVVNVPANPFTLMKSLENLATKSFEAVVKDAEEVEEEEEEVETPNDGDDNENENNDDNANDNPGEEEKEIKTEITDEKADDEEADNDGGDIEEEGNEEENEEEESDPEEDTEDAPDEKNIDGEDEKDIVEDEEEDSENQPETEDGDEEEVDAGENSKAFTTKMIEQIVDAKMGGSKKEVKSLIEKGVKALEKDFDKKLKAVKSDLEKEVDAIVETIKSIKETEEQLVSKIKNTVKGKGFLNLQTTSQKEKKATRLENILTSVKNTKNI